MRETDLYPPVKAFLEAQGYTVKGEVEGCDVVALRGDEPPVVVELKTAFSLPPGLPGDRAAERHRQRLPRDPAVFETHRPQERYPRAVPPPGSRAPGGPARACAVRRGVARSGGVPAAAACGGARKAVEGVPAPGGRSQPGRLEPARDHDRVPAGCPALCRVPRCQRSDESRCRGRRGRRRQDRDHDARRPLRLVRTSRGHAPRGLRPDAEGTRGAGGIRGCRGGAVTRRLPHFRAGFRLRFRGRTSPPVRSRRCDSAGRPVGHKPRPR